MLKEIPPSMRRFCTALAAVGMLVSPAPASADPVLQWNALALGVTAGNPFTQARFMAITQLAVFEAVNAVTGKYSPTSGRSSKHRSASAEAAAIAAAYRVLKNYFPTSVALDPARENSLAAIPDSAAKSRGILTGESAAAAMIANRADDNGSRPRRVVRAGAGRAGQMAAHAKLDGRWVGGVFFDWRTVTPFGIRSVDRFMSGLPPALTSRRYTTTTWR